MAQAETSTPDQSPGARRVFSSFSAELPDDWRRLTPDEAYEMQERLPFALRRVVPGQYDVFGAIDVWLSETGFDGSALTVTTQTGEIPIEPASIGTIQKHWNVDRDAEEGAQDGPKRDFIDGEIIALGKDGHPGIRCEMTTASETGFGPSTSTDYYVPTNGQLLILAFHSWEDSGGRARPLIEPIVKSASFPRPPNGIEDLDDRLGRALIVGALIGLGLIVLRKMRRPPPPPEHAGSPETD